MTSSQESGPTPRSSSFASLYARYLATAATARVNLKQLADHYSKRAKSFGYIPLAGIATASGLTGLLLATRDASGTIDPSKLPDQVREAFALQFPNKYAAGELDNLNETTIQPLMSGWVGKYTEILARDKLNAGESIGGYRLAEGDVARLAASPTQEGWDIIAEPSGQLFQVKSTADLGYVRDAAANLDDDGIIFITTDLDDGADISDLNLLLLEMDYSKDELVALIEDSAEDAVDSAADFGILEDILGPLALVVSAGTVALLIKKAYDEYKVHKSFVKIQRRYGSRMVGKVAAMPAAVVSPVPFTGLVVRKLTELVVGKLFDTRMLLADATAVAVARLDRARRLIRTLGLSPAS